jgi:SAM-dependent methyltransferase
MANLRAKAKLLLRKYFWPRYVTLAAHRLLICTCDAIGGASKDGQLTGNDALQYAEKIFGYYRLCSGVKHFYGHAAEVGPGDNGHVGLMLLSDGCSHVDLVDRFFCGQSGQPRITRHVQAAEKFFPDHAGYDFILSAAVLEHLYDPLEVLRSMCSALNPGGMMIHRVDLRDHGAFSPGLHDLSFLRLPDWLYWPLKIRGGPNRYRVTDYRQCLVSLPVTFGIYVNRLAGVQEDLFATRLTFSELPPNMSESSAKYVAGFRRRLARPFRELPDEDLMITAIAIVAKKNRVSRRVSRHKKEGNVTAATRS